jgi:hypothetical protein
MARTGGAIWRCLVNGGRPMGSGRSLGEDSLSKAKGSKVHRASWGIYWPGIKGLVSKCAARAEGNVLTKYERF